MDEHADPIVGGLDLPSDDQQVGNFLLTSGWAFTHGGQRLLIELVIDGKTVDQGICNFPRYDIYQTYSSEVSYASGFLARIPIRQLADGSHLLEVFAKTDAGQGRALGARNFVKKNSPHLFVGPLGGVGGSMRKSDIGSKYGGIFKRLAGLAQHHDVLEVGCGVGQMAVPLTGFLASGTYHGIDNTEAVVDYCKENITRRFPNFRFSYADVYNKMYNPTGRVPASEYRFPFPNESFDFVFLTSVFTHMLPAGFENYLKEVARVLREHGTCLATFFLLNTEVQNRIDKGQSRLAFRHQFGDCRAENEITPENAIAYEEGFVTSLLRKYNLRMREPIHFGAWSGAKDTLDQQDIVIAERRSRAT